MFLQTLLIIFNLAYSLRYGELKMPNQSSVFQNQAITIKIHLQNNNITIFANLKSYGYFGICYQDRMNQGDFTIVQIIEQSQKVTIKDYHSPGDHKRPVQDKLNHIQQIGYETDSKSYVSVKFTRSLKTQDIQDIELKRGQKFKFAWAKKQGSLTLGHHHKQNDLGLFQGILQNRKIYQQHKQQQSHDQNNALIHGIILTFMWSFLSDIGILVKYIYNYKYRIFTHGLIFLLLTMTTLYQIFSMYQHQQHQNHENKIIPKSLQLHQKFAVIILFWVIFQLIMGCINYIFMIRGQISPENVLLIKKIHKRSGFLIIIIAKINLIIGWIVCGSKLAQFLILLYNIALISIFIKKKFIFVTNRIENYLSLIKNKQLKDATVISYYQQGNYVIFDNKVYELDIQVFIHPGGKSILKEAKSRQIDKFIYGIQRIQKYQKSQRFFHPLSSLKILGNPIYVFSCSNYLINNNQFRVVQRIPFGSMQLLYLKSTKEKVIYKGLGKQLRQFGQYFKVQGFGIIRLYTCMTSLRKQNMKFINQFFAKKQNLTQNVYKFKTKLRNQKFLQTQLELMNTKEELIPLIIKKYEGGAFTSKLFNDIFNNKLMIQGLKGRGLGLDLIQSGQILIIGCGTGIFPFLDILDILFKLIVNEKQEHKFDLSEQNYYLWSKFRFIFYLGVKRIQQLVIIQQLKYIINSKHKNVQIYLRITQNQNQLHTNLILNKFSLNFIQNYTNPALIQKVFICGPSKLYSQVSNIISDIIIPKTKIHYV